MTELTLTLIKVGFLLLLWFFVFSVVSVIRADLFGVSPRETKRQKNNQKPTRTRPSRGKPGSLHIIEGPHAGLILQLGSDPIIMGRGTDATIRLDDDYVSTRHARFLPRGNKWFVEDMGSTNGTYIANQRLTTAVEIGIGVPVRLGKTIVELRK